MSGVPLLVIAKNQGPPRHAHGREALRPPAESHVTEAIRAGARAWRSARPIGEAPGAPQAVEAKDRGSDSALLAPPCSAPRRKAVGLPNLA